MDNHKKFLKHLEESDQPVWAVAKMLVEKGFNVRVNTGGKATKHGDWKKYVDNGDLEISLRIEVKGLGCDFTCQEDWPFGKDFIVCAKHSFDKAIPKPFAYVYLNKQRTHFALVLEISKSKWYVRNRKDSRYQNIQQEFYLINVDQVSFSPLSEIDKIPMYCTLTEQNQKTIW